MKPNDLQKAVAKIVEQQGQFWQQTNDINSPTHFSDIGESFNSMMALDEIDEDAVDIISTRLTDIFVVIRSLKK